MKHNVTLIAALLLAPLAVGTVQAQDQPFGEALKSLTNSTLNMHLCPRGKWEVGEDKWGQIVRVNMLKIEDADWEKVPGVKKAWRMKGFEGVAGMAFHPVISEVKDVDADGKPDIFRLRSEQAGAKIERLRYDDGSVVWESGPVGELYGDEGRLAVYELNGPKDWCVFHADKSGVYCFDAATGQSRWNAKVAGGTFTVGHFLKKDKASIAFHDGGVITCFDESGKQAWQYDTRLRGDNAYSHELLRGDPDGDGLDELFVNMQKLTLALRGDGKLMWEDKTQMHHSDFLLLADVDGDGRKEFIYDHCGCGGGKGPVLIVDALTGQQKASIDYSAGGVSHAQKVVVGKFDSFRGAMQIAIGVKPAGMTRRPPCSVGTTGTATATTRSWPLAWAPTWTVSSPSGTAKVSACTHSVSCPVRRGAPGRSMVEATRTPCRAVTRAYGARSTWTATAGLMSSCPSAAGTGVRTPSCS